jgi:hypothetical protein
LFAEHLTRQLTNRLAETDGHTVPAAATPRVIEKLTTLLREIVDADMRKAGSRNGALRQQQEREWMRGLWTNTGQAAHSYIV